MALYLIGIGLHDAQDLTLKGLAIVKRAHKVYLDTYTSLLQFSPEELQELSGKEVIPASREMLERQSERILEEARTQDVALLITGSPMAATTHFHFLLEGKKRKILVYVVENASVFSAVGITGLFLYKFGMTLSIPRRHEHLDTPYQKFLQNRQSGLHTLFLLDTEGNPLSAREGLDYLLSKGLAKDTLVVGCAALGSLHPEIVVDAAAALHLKTLPQCFIIPGELHFIEEEALAFWKAYGLH